MSSDRCVILRSLLRRQRQCLLGGLRRIATVFVAETRGACSEVTPEGVCERISLIEEEDGYHGPGPVRGDRTSPLSPTSWPRGVAQYMIQRGLVDLSDATDAC